MTKIAFHSNQISIRGTEVALYDYAHYNEEILNNESIIIAKDPSIWSYSHPLAISKFEKRFKNINFYKDVKEIDNIIKSNDVDMLYCIKAGLNDGIVSKNVKTVVHSVFQHHQPHGDVYAYISEWLGDRYKSPYVPHIVDLPDIEGDLRDVLGIPRDAIVFGRHGGLETFDILFAHEAIKNVLRERDDIYFVFLYTDKFYEHPNIIYLEGNQDMEYKVKFINTCDAMLHARTVGETFGLSVAEFSLRNKPVYTYGGRQRESAHLDMLGNNCFKYHNKADLYEKIMNFTTLVNPNYNWNMYRDYNPETVINKFKKVFIDG